MYKIEFYNISEIRMGSPYNSVCITVQGVYFPSETLTADETFQDKYALSPDGNTCFLIAWNTEQNEPGFSVWKVSNLEKSIIKSQRFSGCCDEIFYDSETEIVTLRISEYPKGKRVEKLRL